MIPTSKETIVHEQTLYDVTEIHVFFASQVIKDDMIRPKIIGLAKHHATVIGELHSPPHGGVQWHRRHD